MMPLDNKHTESLEEYLGEDLNITHNQDVRACYMAKKTVTRDKLISWLETICCILDSFALPLLDCGTGMIVDYQKLKDEKILDQETKKLLSSYRINLLKREKRRFRLFNQLCKLSLMKSQEFRIAAE